MRLSSRDVVLALVTFACPLTATAAPISVLESAEFSDWAPGSSVGTLDVGVNTIKGELPAGVSRDIDVFQVDLPMGLRIVGLDVVVSGYNEPWYVRTLEISEYESTSPTGSLGVGGQFRIWGNSTHSFSGLDFDMPGMYVAQLGSSYGLIDDRQAAAGGYTYEVRYTVEAVPVPAPATVILLGLGLAGFLQYRLRRRR